MAVIVYRCIFCDSSHEISRRSDGAVYLRCPTTYRWAWYDARAFESARPSRGARRAASGSTAGARRRAGTARAKTAAPRRAGRKTAGRPAARKGAKKRGRR